MNDADARTVANDHPESIFFDGVTSRRRLVTLRFETEALIISNDDENLAIWPYSEIRRVQRPGFVLRRNSYEAPIYARLEVREERLQLETLAHCHSLHSHDSAISTRRIAFWSVAATAIVASLIWFGVPFAADRLAPLVPAGLERWIGESVESQVRAYYDHEVCGSEPGTAALSLMSRRLRDAAKIESEATIEVLDTTVPNALALPGGKIYLLSGLLDRARSPDEVGGVIAHELGHIAHRDALRSVIAIGGTSYLLGLFFGDVTGSTALVISGEALVGAAHSREQEAEADQFAAEVMTRLGRPAKPLGELLMRIAGSEESVLGLLHDHPFTVERFAAFSAADRGERGPPLLDAEQWAALKAICETSDVKP